MYRKNGRVDPNQLFAKKEQPLAIMVPAWQEVGVIGKMAELAAKTLDYENYQIFVGTYPNDPQTQADVDAVCAQYSNVHKVVCARPGPTSKADCLNNVVASIVAFEEKAKITFSGFILHDAEDVLSPMELRLFNFLLPSKDLIQLPVYPYARKWCQFTPAHYLDEFAETHGKDVVVREALAGQVPSAGVGTCFSRKAILKLLKEGDGLPFDVQSLTEDYDIGFRLKQWGLNEIFVQFPAMPKEAILKESAFGIGDRASRYICVREYFPATFSTAVRQKSRWIIGIVFQGMKNHSWSKDWKINYFLWRDRRGVISNTIAFLATLIFLHLLMIAGYQFFVKDSYQFLSIFNNDPVVRFFIFANAFFFLNRMTQRFIFVTQYYGLFQGLMSLPRVVWGNVINFAANMRAVKQVIAQGDPRRVAWDKTTHDFPVIDDNRRTPLGQILIEQGAISETRLDDALLHLPPNMRLGAFLVREGYVSNEAVSQAIAQQAGAKFDTFDPFAVDADLIANFPSTLALKYMVFPLSKTKDKLVLAAESQVSPVALAAIQRQTGKFVSYRIVEQGLVTLGIRYHYMNDTNADYRPMLEQTEKQGVTSEQVKQHLDKYLVSQQPLGMLLVAEKLLEPAVLNQALINYDYSPAMKFGEFLKEHGYITEDQLNWALAQQAQQQPLANFLNVAVKA
ncbi:glycosyl transferase family protein [Enterovibrio coralii]|uniref:glycosyl transferase family protein n=1 Tax=Enterovibrio coralii TaxID=294935 RepID=UPI000A8F7E31|nr:glycosyl transferase family protein [Enterovibrio coralii]